MVLSGMALALIISGIASVVGAGISAAANYGMNKENREDSQDFTEKENALSREFTADEAQKSRDFEEYMSNTAMQRTVADYKAAGINVGALGGSSASSGASATGLSAAQSGLGSSALSNVFGSHSIDSFLSNLVNTTARQTLQQNSQDFAYNMRHNIKMSTGRKAYYNFNSDDSDSYPIPDWEHNDPGWEDF